ncbi:MAG: MBL fold metallo-hydrolase [Planctomycetes bacterium]|nr:MBL fold metallo-hydrolase [Planctomycetota bacterium]
MAVRFHVLASGSNGNACVLDVDGFGILVDFGLSPRMLAPRMKQCGVSWDRIHVVLLTHEHTDHWQQTTLAHLAKQRLPIHCHTEHVKAFDASPRAFAALDSARLFRHYEPGQRIALNADCTCTPIELSHDCSVTCGFRFDGPGWSIAYAADLGCWTKALARQFADVDLLALEFNHDVAMQLASGRHPRLIRRVLGDAGHLSNDQAAKMVAEILKISTPGRLQHLVQLHLSRDCNRPELAAAAARRTLERLSVDFSVHTTDQQRAGPSITLGDATVTSRELFAQALLPFGE